LSHITAKILGRKKVMSQKDHIGLYIKTETGRILPWLKDSKKLERGIFYSLQLLGLFLAQGSLIC
jgi:hypothetical protein